MTPAQDAAQRSEAPRSLGAVCLVDDHGEFRQSAAWWLESLGYAVTTYDDPQAFLDAGDPPPDACLLFDVRMPTMSGLELLDAVKARGCERPVIFMTGHADVPLAVQLMKAGVVDFIEKPFDPEQILDCVGRCIASLSSLEADRTARDEARSRLATLTTRERQVFDALIDGCSNKEIALRLEISPRTVEIFRAKVMTKMQASNLSTLVRMGMRAGDA